MSGTCMLLVIRLLSMESGLILMDVQPSLTTMAEQTWLVLVRLAMSSAIVWVCLIYTIHRVAIVLAWICGM